MPRRKFLVEKGRRLDGPSCLSVTSYGNPRPLTVFLAVSSLLRSATNRSEGARIVRNFEEQKMSQEPNSLIRQFFSGMLMASPSSILVHRHLANPRREISIDTTYGCA